MTTLVKVTAAMLYDLVQCPHRLSMDLFVDPKYRDEVNPFIQLLWEKGTAYEAEVISGLTEKFVDLSKYSGDEKQQLTIKSMQDGESLIYGGRISSGDLLGEPDLLRKEDGKYIAGDIKSGGAEEGGDDNSKLKKHYGVQVALYTDILVQLGFLNSATAFIWDVKGKEVIYDLEAPQGNHKQWTLWGVYNQTLIQARKIIDKSETSHPAYSGICKMCHWYSKCKKDLKNSDDLSLLPELGRSKRDAMVSQISTIEDLSKINIEHFIRGKKTTFDGIGPSSLQKFHDRAKLTKTKGAKPYLTQPVQLPRIETELFFDIEVDPMRDLCYLHGFVERRNGDKTTEKYLAFFANNISKSEEERAFTEAWNYILKNKPCMVYYYKNIYSKKGDLTSLSLWHGFEQQNPDIFAGMYQFWCLKN